MMMMHKVEMVCVSSPFGIVSKGRESTLFEEIAQKSLKCFMFHLLRPSCCKKGTCLELPKAYHFDNEINQKPWRKCY